MADGISHSTINRREFITATALAGAAAASLGFPALLKAADENILIGDIHPLSGYLASDGEEAQNAIRLAVHEINNAGGIKSLGGAKLKSLSEDSAGKPDQAVRAVEKLYKQGAVAILGCFQSPVTMKATEVAEQMKVPLMVTVSVADEITGRGFKYCFRIQADAKQMGEQTVKYLSEIIKAHDDPSKTIAHIYNNTHYGDSLSTHVAKFAPKYGLEVVLRVPYSSGTTDVSAEVGKLKAAGADIVMDTGYFSDSVEVFKSITSQRVRAKAIVGCGNGAYSHPRFIKELGAITENVMDCNYMANPRSPMTQKTFAAYKKTYGADMSHSAVIPYQAVYVLADAIERAGSTNRTAVRDALASTKLKKHILPQGPIVFGPDGQNANAHAPMMQIQKGAVKVVWPEAYAEAGPIFPVKM